MSDSLDPSLPVHPSFTNVTVNYNGFTKVHCDIADVGICAVFPCSGRGALGSWSGGDLSFPQLKMAVPLLDCQGAAFRSGSLDHLNAYGTGFRAGVVYHTNDGFGPWKENQNGIPAELFW